MNLKKIMYAVVGGVLGLALFISLSSLVGAASSSNIFNAGGGNVGAYTLQMSEKALDKDLQSDSNSVIYKDGNQKNEDALFRLVGTSVFENLLSFGQTRFHKLSVGYAGQNTPGTELSVNGTVTIKELADASRGDNLVPACVNDFGVIVACDPAAFTCTGAAPANATLCTNDGTNLFTNTGNTLTASCSVPAEDVKCEYTCNTGFNLQGGACVADETYSWNTGTWGSCTSTGAGSCSGTYTTTTGSGGGNKIDWNGNPMEWIDGRLYIGSVPGTFAADCGAPNDLEVGNNVHLDAGNGGIACIVNSVTQFPTGTMYELSVIRDSWDRHTIDSNGIITNVQTNYAPAYSSAFACEAIPGNENITVYTSNSGGTYLGTGTSWCNTLYDCSQMASPGGTDPNQVVCQETTGSSSTSHSCSGLSQSSCTSHGTCNWAAGGSTETRTVTCHQSSDNAIVDDSFCPPPKPLESQSCSGGISGVCGSADGGTFTSAPTSNLCSSGVASVVVGGGKSSGEGSDIHEKGSVGKNLPILTLLGYTWTCSGSGGGTTASCSAFEGSSGGGGGSCSSPSNSPMAACNAIGMNCYWQAGRYCNQTEVSNEGCQSTTYNDGNGGSCERVACFPSANPFGTATHCF